MARLPAGTRKRKDGTLEKRFTVNNRRYSVYGKNTQELTDKEQELREQIKAGSYVNNRSITLGKYFEYWISEKEKSVKKNSVRTYENMYRKNISPRLENRRVHTIERREVAKLQSDLIADGVSIYTVNYTIMVLRMILEDAIRDEIIVNNPASNIKYLRDDNKIDATSTIHKALSVSEQSLFMESVKDNQYYELFALLISTGMRFGEATALQWSDIDYVNNVIHITKTVTVDRDYKLFIGTPKSKTSIRDIPMNDSIKSILKQAKAKSMLMDGNNVIPINGLVFKSRNGTFVNNATVNHIIADAVKRLQADGHDIERFSVHCLRDTFATRFCEAGGNPQTLKTILGHSSLSLTMDLYSQVLPNTKQSEMDRIVIAI